MIKKHAEKGQMLITNDGGKNWRRERRPIRVNPWHVSEIFKEITVSGPTGDVIGAGFDEDGDRPNLKNSFLG